MGTFAHGDVELIFNSKEDAKKVHKIISSKEIEEQFKNILGESGAGDYCFYNFSEAEGESIGFEYSSGRVQNAEWQISQLVELLRALVKSKEISGVAELNSSLYEDAGGQYMESHEFE